MSDSEEITYKPDINDSFRDCKTGRVLQAEVLTDLLINKHRRLRESDNRRNGETNTFSLNIDASWGMGKTFFIECWSNHLAARGHLILKFNAWEHDYSKDPMTSLLTALFAEIENRMEVDKTFKDKVHGIYEQAKDKGIKLVKTRASSLLGLGASILTDFGVAALATAFMSDGSEKTELDENSAKFAKIIGEGAAEQLFDSSVGYRSALDHFKKAMRKLVASIEEKGVRTLPIFVFIDDLDRCRPDFSIEILESVKHILDIDSIYFIFTTDTEQLQYSLKAVYGESFDAKKYLYRVFNRHCCLAPYEGWRFSDYIFEGFEKYFNSKELIFLPKGKDMAAETALWFPKICEAYKLDLRAQLACRDQIVDFIDASDGRPILWIPLLHLIVLWNKDRDLALKQVASQQIVKRKDLSYPLQVKISSVKYKTNGDGQHEDLSMLDALGFYYSYLNHNPSQIDHKDANHYWQCKREAYSAVYDYLRFKDSGEYQYFELKTLLNRISLIS